MWRVDEHVNVHKVHVGHRSTLSRAACSACHERAAGDKHPWPAKADELPLWDAYQSFATWCSEMAGQNAIRLHADDLSRRSGSWLLLYPLGNYRNYWRIYM